MSRLPGWRDLLPGVATVAILAAIVVGVLLFARVGALRGDTRTLVVLAGSSRELLVGSDVWLEGQKVGAVRDIAFRPPSSDTALRLAITLDVLADAWPQLRADTRAQIATGGSLLGAPVMHLAGGTPEARQLAGGDTIRALPAVDPQTVGAGFANAGREVPALRRNVAGIVAELRDADGTLGAAVREGGFARAGALAQSLGRLGARLTGGQGTAGRLMAADGEVRARLLQVRARADSLRLVLDSPVGTVGRFRRDSTLARQIGAVRDEVSLVRALVDLPAGTAGRALHDDALLEQLRTLEVELGALAADVRAHPDRYIVF